MIDFFRSDILLDIALGLAIAVIAVLLILLVYIVTNFLRDAKKNWQDYQ